MTVRGRRRAPDAEQGELVSGLASIVRPVGQLGRSSLPQAGQSVFSSLTESSSRPGPALVTEKQVPLPEVRR